MSKTATQTVEETDLSRRFSMTSMWSAKSDLTLTPPTKYTGYAVPPFHPQSQKATSIPSNPPRSPTKPALRKYFQPDPRILATATDRTIIEVPVHEMHMPRRKTLAVIGRMNDRLMGGVGPNEEFRLLRMPLCEYTRYWARDEAGVYVGTEPEGDGHERLRAQGW